MNTNTKVFFTLCLLTNMANGILASEIGLTCHCLSLINLKTGSIIVIGQPLITSPGSAGDQERNLNPFFGPDFRNKLHNHGFTTGVLSTPCPPDVESYNTEKFCEQYARSPLAMALTATALISATQPINMTLPTCPLKPVTPKLPRAFHNAKNARHEQRGSSRKMRYGKR